MNKVEALLNKYARDYYAGEPTISDAVFDALANSIGYKNIGAKQHAHLENHFYPLFSLQKFYEDEGKRSPFDPNKDTDMSPKLDGAAVSILYINGDLVRVMTRGDGTEGTVITDKFLATKLIPHSISLPGIVQVDGEVAAPKHIENSRNYAAGSLNLNSIDEFRTRAINFFAYNLRGTDISLQYFSTAMTLLSKEGFNTVKDPEIQNIYPCDGVVFRLNSYKEFNDAGYTTNFPRGAYALKERGEAVETKLLRVDWQVGKSGKVTPVAILEPCKIGDKVIAKATLNNISFIRALDIQIGDTLAIMLGGEIIPVVAYKVE